MKEKEWREKTGLSHYFWTKIIVPAVINIKGNKCEDCSSKKWICVHHTDYKVQTIDTLKVLCLNCHMGDIGEGVVDKQT